MNLSIRELEIIRDALAFTERARGHQVAMECGEVKEKIVNNINDLIILSGEHI